MGISLHTQLVYGDIMDSDKPIVERNEKGKLVINLEQVEEFLDYCERLEKAVNTFKTVLGSTELNDAILDVYDPEREPASEDIVKSILTLKKALAEVA